MSKKGLIRVSEAATGDPSDVSDAVFTVSSDPIIVVTAPNGGEKWPIRSTQNITWISMGVGTNVKIEYSKDAGVTWIVIVDSTENFGTYAWTPPDDAISPVCLVAISEATTGTPTDTSDGFFEITATASPRAAAPAGKAIKPATPPKIIKRLKAGQK